MRSVNELLESLKLNKIGEDKFQGKNESIGSPNIFGGQIIAQHLEAAYLTVNDDYTAHSMHVYFLAAGNLSIPLEYQVEIVRDGRTYCNRKIYALQNEKIISEAMISFNKKEDVGLSHQMKKPFLLRTPNILLNWSSLANILGGRISKRAQEFLTIDRPIEFKPVEIERKVFTFIKKAKSHVWFRFRKPIENLTIRQKQVLLAYTSDYNILFSCLEAHSNINPKKIIMASLDHAMWFYRDFEIDDWFLYQLLSPSTSNGRGFATGNIYTKKGKLVASVSQEGVFRLNKSSHRKQKESS